MNASVMEDKPTIYIKTLGGFSLRVGDKEITDNSNQSKKPWCLLEYLVVFQKKSISPGELINIVWADDPGVNPGGALKTLMFRSRKLLEPLGIPPQKLLVQQRGSYCWTQDYLSVLDIDQFESICTRVLNHDMDEDEALNLCLEGLELYKGDFLPKSEYESWVIPISTYYHSLYQKLVYKTVELLTKKEDFSRITSICQTAVGIEPFDEEFHYHLVYSLYRDGHTSQAIEEYNHTLDLFYNEFSISPSDHLRIYTNPSAARNRVSIQTWIPSRRRLRRKPQEGLFTVNILYSTTCSSWNAGPSSVQGTPSICVCSPSVTWTDMPRRQRSSTRPWSI